MFGSDLLMTTKIVYTETPYTGGMPEHSADIFEWFDLTSESPDFTVAFDFVGNTYTSRYENAGTKVRFFSDFNGGREELTSYPTIQAIGDPTTEDGRKSMSLEFTILSDQNPIANYPSIPEFQSCYVDNRLAVGFTQGDPIEASVVSVYNYGLN
jgi:hypothetical protein